MEQTKLTLKIYEPMLLKFDKQIADLFLKRDAFLNHMLRSEIPHLREDLGNKRQSAAARRYISGELKKLGTHTVNVVVDKDVANMLNEVVESSNMVRDAFANRLLMFLRSTPELLRYLDLPTDTDSLGTSRLGLSGFSTAPLTTMEQVLADPMYYLRRIAKEDGGEGLYALALPDKFVGFSCYLPDELVPGTIAKKEPDLVAPYHLL